MPMSAADFWENRYRENGRSWSGNVNAALEREIAGVEPGSALDLGSGEGGDALWLAHNGWSVTAVDISATALAFGAAAEQPGDDITWIAADLAEWHPPTRYDLVTSCFLHSKVHLPRERILRRAAAAVASGGIFLVVGHSGAPHWDHPDGAAHEHPLLELPTPDDVFATLFSDESADGRLDSDDWTVLTNAIVERITTGPDGISRAISDSVLTLRRNR
ncbi:class I SAM-dependent methyltransferase [Lacisediminihabitans sp. FW035]